MKTSLRGMGVVLAMFVALRIGTVFSAEMAVWTMGASDRAQPETAPNWQKTVSIQCARNEYEPFQVVVTAQGGDITVTGVEASDLAGEGGKTIPKSAITLYREHFIEVKQPSSRCTTPPGLWPDPLIPFVNPVDGAPIKEARFVALPCEVKTGKNQPFWADVFVPKDAAAGAYKGKVTVTAEGLPAIEVPVELKVWDFALPDTSSVKSEFGGMGGAAASHKMKPNDPAWRPIEMRYLEACAAHRITPQIPGYMRPKANPDGTLDTSATHAEMKAFVERLHVNAISVPFTAYKDPLKAGRELTKKCLDNYYQYLKENGWEKKNYIYILDEPNDEKAYEEVRQRAAVAHEANKGLRVLCTEQTVSSDPKWGTLVGAVDIWVPLWPLHDEKTAAERLAAGDELWSYTALCQGKPESPFWETDFPVLNYRVPLWINWRCHMTGLLYWSMVYWKGGLDMWTDAMTYLPKGAKLGYNGEGSLFYPGADAGIDGPVASMRLKNIREGMEDYEYMQMLADMGERAFVDEVVQSVGRSWFDWEKDPAKLYAARARLAEKIVEKKTPR